MEPFRVLLELKTKLTALPGVKTCKIGLESGLSPDDYPIVRIVPLRLQRVDVLKAKMELTIYYGLPLTEAEGGLEPLYQSLLALEADIKRAVQLGNGYTVTHLDTITDEDRLEHFKIFASRFEVLGFGE